MWGERRASRELGSPRSPVLISIWLISRLVVLLSDDQDPQGREKGNERKHSMSFLCLVRRSRGQRRAGSFLP
jgi:hypothetical protein